MRISWRAPRSYQQIVPVFTNVIFDTSQPHSNVVFRTCLPGWTACLSGRSAPETLFVIRAHPDEARPGKESRESVAEWVERAGCWTCPT
jgi:hypothetical protein